MLTVECQVVWDGNGIELRYLDGRPFEPDKGENGDAWWIYMLKEKYEEKPISVYVGIKAEAGLFKVGVSENTSRREREIAAPIRHAIPCAAHKARILESALHYWLKDYAFKREWFYLKDGGLAAAYRIMELKTQHDLIEFVAARMTEWVQEPFDPKARQILDILGEMYKW